MIRDAGFVAIGLLYGLVPQFPSWISGVTLPGIVLATYGLVLGYSVLSTQLFGIDLKIKIGIRRGFLAAPFAVAFFVATETLEGLLPFQSYWAGLMAAGALSLAAAPLHRWASKAADRMMPGVDHTPAYLDARAKYLYQAALQAARADGDVTAKEQAMLDRLAKELGIAPSATSVL